MNKVYVITTGDGEDGNEFQWHSIWSTRDKAEIELKELKKLEPLNFDNASIEEHDVDKPTYVYKRGEKCDV